MTEEKVKKKTSHKKKEVKHTVKKPKQDPTIPWKIVCAILAILLIIAIFSGGFSFKSTPNEKKPVQTDGDALVLIEEYSDFECPFCSKFYKEAYTQIKAEYGDKVKFEFKHFPLSFHAKAQKASEAAECARDQDKFWEMHDILFENNNKLSIADLKGYADTLELDTAKFDACLDSGEKEAKVLADMAEGQKRGVSGTPAFFINGEMLVGAQPFTAFKQIIDKALGAAGEDVVVTEDPEVQLTVLNDATCEFCDTSTIIDVTTTQIFPTATVTEVDVSSKEGKALMEELQAKFVPVYVFDESIKDTANFAQVENVMVQIGDKYIINPAAVDSVKLLEVSEDDDAVLGDENAPVTIVEFSEFECPFCAKFYDGAYQQIKEKYVETGKVKIIFRDFPLSFHANAQKAAEATECAEEQGKFWEMHDTLFENQASIAVDDLKKYAVDLGLDAEAFNACLDSGKYAEEIEKDMNDGAALGVSGTPGFFINGIKLSGAQPFENFEAIIESELN